jgi:hypothetical protein
VRPFDSKSYLAQVLGPYRDSAELPGLFERYLLEVGDADEAAIASRLDEVKRYWDKKSEHARYGATIRALIEKHPEAKLTLGDPRERERLAEEVRESARRREEESARAVREWDELLEQMVASAGGLDPVNRARLEKMAASTGIDPAATRAKLDAAPVAAEPEVLDRSRREEIAPGSASSTPTASSSPPTARRSPPATRSRRRQTASASRTTPKRAGTRCSR